MRYTRLECTTGRPAGLLKLADVSVSNHFLLPWLNVLPSHTNAASRGSRPTDRPPTSATRAGAGAAHTSASSNDAAVASTSPARRLARVAGREAMRAGSVFG